MQFNGVNIANNYAINGGGLYTNISLILEDTNILNSVGALQVDNSSWQNQDNYFVTIKDSNISDNISKNSNGVVHFGIVKNIDINNSIFTDNNSTGNGAFLSINAYDNLSYVDSNFTHNFAPYILFEGLYEDINFINCTINDNIVDYGYIIRATSINMKDSNISNNQANIIIDVSGGDRWNPNLSALNANYFIGNISSDHNNRTAMFNFNNTIVTNTVFMNNKTESINATMMNLNKGYIVNCTFFDNIDESSHKNGTLSLNGVMINSIINDQEGTNSIIFSGDSYVYNSYVDYASMDLGSYTVLRRNNFKPTTTSISLDSLAKPDNDSFAIDSGLSPISDAFSNIVDEEYIIYIREALSSDIQHHTRSSENPIDIGAYEIN
jgi:hypothetical protein